MSQGLVRGLFLPPGSAGGGGITNINVSAGTTSNNLSNLVFSNSNNVTFGLDGSTITATAGAGGGAVNFSAGTTSNNLGSVVFSNSNGVSFGLNGSTITGSIATSLTNIRVSAGTTSNLLSAVTFANSNGLTFGLDASTITGSHNALTSQSNQNVTAANGGFAFQTLSFSNLNGVSFGTAAGSAITASHNAITSQTNQQMTMFATGNTTLSSTGTTNASSLIFRGSGAASIGITNGSVLIDVAAGAAAITQSIGISTETAGGATAGTSGYATGDDILYHFVPGSNITMSQSLNGASATLSIYGASGGGGGDKTLSYYDNLIQGSTATLQIGNATLRVFPYAPANEILPGVITANTVQLNMTGTVSTGAAFTRSLSIGFYTLANSTQLSLAFSASTSWGTNAANMNVNDSMAGWRWVTIHSSQFNNAPQFSASRYYCALWNRSTSGSQSFSHFGNQSLGLSNSRSGTMGTGSSNNTTLAWYPFNGIYSVTFSTAMPDSIAESAINKAVAEAFFIPQVVLNNLRSII